MTQTTQGACRSVARPLDAVNSGGAALTPAGVAKMTHRQMASLDYKAWQAVVQAMSGQYHQAPERGAWTRGAGGTVPASRYGEVTTGTTRTVPRGDQPAATKVSVALDQYKQVLVELDDLDRVKGQPGSSWIRWTRQGRP